MIWMPLHIYRSNRSKFWSVCQCECISFRFWIFFCCLECERVSAASQIENLNQTEKKRKTNGKLLQTNAPVVSLSLLHAAPQFYRYCLEATGRKQIMLAAHANSCVKLNRPIIWVGDHYTCIASFCACIWNVAAAEVAARRQDDIVVRMARRDRRWNIENIFKMHRT